MIHEKIYQNIILRLYESSTSNSIVDRIAHELSRVRTNNTIEEIIHDHRENLINSIGAVKFKELYRGDEQKIKLSACKQFVSDNIKEFYQILKSKKEFKYKGAGSWGMAFDLGDHILKIEYITKHNTQFSGHERSTKTDQFLWNGWVNGKILPMIYDKGYFHFYEAEYSWTVLEKFENIKDHQIEVILDDLIQEMGILVLNGHSSDMIIHDIKNRKEFINHLDHIKEKLFLANDWLESLLKSMKQLQKGGFPVDFHGGNIGIRRIGKSGELIFFD